MPNVCRSAVLMSVAVLAAITAGCTERVDLAPVLSGHQHINDAYPDEPYPDDSYPPPVTSGSVPPQQRQQKTPPAPPHPYPKASIPVKREAPAARPDPVMPAERNEAKRKPKTIASALTAKKSIMPKTEPEKPARKATAHEKKPSRTLAKNDHADLNFGWPLAGNILKSYTQTGKKGIRIAGKKGQTVRAAEAGKVVYSGQGLIGYGNLLIIKHNSQYLTAYANNSALLAKEGDVVEKGQGIATVGAGAAQKAMLHFEIRKQGKSVNPLTLLPKL